MIDEKIIRKCSDNSEIIMKFGNSHKTLKSKQKIIFFSKDYKEALRYFINPEYIDYEDLVTIENKYADKHCYLLEHQLLYRK